MVPLRHARHAGADVDDDARALVPEDDGEEPLRVAAGTSELVRVAHAGGADFDEDLARLGAVEVDGLDDEGFTGFVGDGSAGLHGGGRVHGGAIAANGTPRFAATRESV